MHLGVRSCVHVEVHEREHERAGVHAFPRAHGRFACVRLPVSVHEVSARCICIKALSESWRTSDFLLPGFLEKFGLFFL